MGRLQAGGSEGRKARGLEDSSVLFSNIMASFSSHREKPNLAMESIGLGLKLPITLGPAPRLPSFHGILSGPTSHYGLSSFSLPSFFCTTVFFFLLCTRCWPKAGRLEGRRVGGLEG